MQKQSLVRELRAILADYVHRIDTIGAEAFRLRGEPFAAWDRKQHRIQLCLELLKEAVQADDRGTLDELLREVAKVPEVPIPPSAGLLTRVAEGNVATLRQRLADLHREHPECCPGGSCPCQA